MNEERKKVGTESIEHTPFIPESSEFSRIIDEKGLVHYGGETIVRVQEKAEWARKDIEKVWEHVIGGDPAHTALADELGVQKQYTDKNTAIDTMTTNTVEEIKRLSGVQTSKESADATV